MTDLLIEDYQKAVEENRRLRGLILAFCAHHSWAVDIWKDQPHIKPLFEEAKALGGGE